MPGVVGVFAEGSAAGAVVDDLKAMGIAGDDISLVRPNEAPEGNGGEDRDEHGRLHEDPLLTGAAASVATMAGSLGGGLLAIPGAGTYVGRVRF